MRRTKQKTKKLLNNQPAGGWRTIAVDVMASIDQLEDGDEFGNAEGMGFGNVVATGYRNRCFGIDRPTERPLRFIWKTA